MVVAQYRECTHCLWIIYFFFKSHLKNYLCLFIFWERESKPGRGRERIPSRHYVVSTEPSVGLKLTNCEIMTWVETKSQTLNWPSYPGSHALFTSICFMLCEFHLDKNYTCKNKQTNKHKRKFDLCAACTQPRPWPRSHFSCPSWADLGAHSQCQGTKWAYGADYCQACSWSHFWGTSSKIPWLKLSLHSNNQMF